jgi:hypothetical protein
MGLADFLVERMARVLLPQRLLESIKSAPHDIAVLGVGNSLIQYGFDSKAIERVCRESRQVCSAFDAGLGGTGTVVHVAVARSIIKQRSVKTIVYGFYDFQMVDNWIGTNPDLTGNNSILYHVDQETALKYAYYDTLHRTLFSVYKHVALLRESYAIQGDVEKLRRSVGSVGMPPEQTNWFGRVADFALVESPDSVSFANKCRAVIKSGKFLADPLAELFEEARRGGIRLIVVEMPMSRSHLSRFYNQPVWGEFRYKTKQAAEAAGATYLDASRWMSEGELFVDHVHLSAEGARKFSGTLAGNLFRTFGATALARSGP